MSGIVTSWTVVRRMVLMGLVALTCTACISTYRKFGYVPTPSELSEIQVGKDTRETVFQAIGSPGASGVLKDSGYYYIASRMRYYGATEPKLVNRELVAISFDSRGVVSGVERYGLEDGRVIPLEHRVTDNGESDRTFIQQLLRNIGRINPGDFAQE